jgi:type I restriction enzyme S subunit
MNEAQTRLNKIAPKLRNVRWGIDRLQANHEKISQECDALKQAILRQVFE